MKLQKIYDVFEEALPTIFFMSVFVVMTFGVFSRYVLGFYASWSVEFSSYSFVWLSFVGAAYVRRFGSHIKIEIMYAMIEPALHPVVRMVIWLFKEIIILLFLVLLIVFSFQLASRSALFRSQAMQLSQFWLYIAPAVGGVLFTIREIPDAYRQFKKGFNEPTTKLGA